MKVAPKAKKPTVADLTKRIEVLERAVAELAQEIKKVDSYASHNRMVGIVD